MDFDHLRIEPSAVNFHDAYKKTILKRRATQQIDGSPHFPDERDAIGAHGDDVTRAMARASIEGMSVAMLRHSIAEHEAQAEKDE